MGKKNKKKNKSQSLWQRIQQNLGSESTQQSFGSFLQSLYKLNPEFAKLQKQKTEQEDIKRNSRYLR